MWKLWCYIFANETFPLPSTDRKWKATYCSRVFPHCSKSQGPSCLSNKLKIRKLEPVLSSNTRMQTISHLEREKNCNKAEILSSGVFRGCVLKPEKRPLTPDSSSWHVQEENFSLRINKASGLIIIALIWVVLRQEGHRPGEPAPPYRSSAAAHSCWCIALNQWAPFPTDTKRHANDKDDQMRARTRCRSFKERPLQ